MNNEYSVKEKLTLLLLATGVFCFGVILPDSFSDHVKLVHFSAHFGMSFLLALCFYLLCTVKWKISKSFTYTILVTATLFIGIVYKFWEIATHGEIGILPILTIMDRSSVMTSMSQNLSGLLAGMLLIEGLLDRNLIISAYRSGNLHLAPGSMQVLNLPGMNPGNFQGSMQGGTVPAGTQFSPDRSGN
jgi:hypothetical protein